MLIGSENYNSIGVEHLIIIHLSKARSLLLAQRAFHLVGNIKQPLCRPKQRSHLPLEIQRAHYSHSLTTRQTTSFICLVWLWIPSQLCKRASKQLAHLAPPLAHYLQIYNMVSPPWHTLYPLTRDSVSTGQAIHHRPPQRKDMCQSAAKESMGLRSSMQIQQQVCSACLLLQVQDSSLILQL
ncbi:hypothetical protein FGO68_gene15319 [Halteria grandinella]|uniref:Uncharacterized protein n=1 Tax=Halteria grandinella TaxID=5974 RepID=A0A8J8NFL2_HALGN|nr:hypothetical protein FGO68_gene15319 [Halteria grandinella]